MVRHQPIDNLQVAQFGVSSGGIHNALQRRGTNATTFSQYPGRDSQGSRLLPSDIHLLGCDDRCVVIVTAIFMDRCSCRLKVRSLRVAAAFFRPIALQLFDKYVMLSLVVALDFSLFFETPFWHQKGRLVFSATAASLIWSSDDTQKDFSWLPLVSSSTDAPTDSMWRSGEICQVLSTKAFTSFCQARDGIVVLHSQGTIALCLHTLRKTVQTVSPSCALVCPRGGLLHVSRLLGLTLRHSAPVCCCRRDS